ncbi:MAG TPA: quinone-dependent dihydroorotate dehydrogenase, partial [Bacteroidetes bacterium]|nr:quinone-dependent dihydroorotate dehydrogenase [Bacteroidota bacterium]
MDPEIAHNRIHKIGIFVSRFPFMISFLEFVLVRKSTRLSQQIQGNLFNNPVGLAAGFDKNAHLTSLISAIGFGFTEIGSITANPSNGNALPRMFRLPQDHGIINRMGLNNDGAMQIVDRIMNSQKPTIPLGINIAKTHDPAILGDKAIEDYIISFKIAQNIADYITINISCPNTEEGKTFEDADALQSLLSRIKEIRQTDRFIPVYVKLSADLSTSELETLVSICEKNEIDGYIATNTSSKRENLTANSTLLSQSIGKGGLSGASIYSKSLNIVHDLARITNGKKPIIAVGGIDSTEKAIEMIRNGAWLIQ